MKVLPAINWTSKNVKVSMLQPASYNPRKISKDQFERLKDSISTYGLGQNISVNTDLTVIGGHQRLRAIQELGWEEVAVNVPDRKLSELGCKDLNIRYNALMGEFVDDLLQPLLIELEKDGFDLELTGLDSKFLDLPVEVVEDDAPEVRETEIKRGNVFKLGGHRLMCGDSTVKEDVEKFTGREAEQL